MESNRISWRLAATLSISLSALGCTFENGEGFSTLEGGSVSARLETENRTVLTNLAYTVHLDSAKLEISDVVLSELDESGNLAPVVTMPIDRELDWLAGEKLEFDRVIPSRELPLAKVEKASVMLGKLTLAGNVTSGDLGTTTATLTATLVMAPALEQDYAWTIDRDAPEKVRIDVDAVTGSTLFDELDFAKRVQSGAVALTNADDPDLLRIATSLSNTELVIERK